MIGIVVIELAVGLMVFSVIGLSVVEHLIRIASALERLAEKDRR